MSLPRCHKKRCAAILEERAGRFGALTFICVPCERNARGLCRSCPARTVQPKKGRAMYCAKCRAKRRRIVDQQRYWHGDKRDRDIGRQRARRDDPAIYADILEKQRRRQPTPPRDDLDRLYHRTYAKSRRAGAKRTTVDRRNQRTAA